MPISKCIFPAFSSFSSTEIPKSIKTMRPLRASTKLLGAISRCAIPRSWRYTTASSICAPSDWEICEKSSVPAGVKVGEARREERDEG